MTSSPVWFITPQCADVDTLTMTHPTPPDESWRKLEAAFGCRPEVEGSPPLPAAPSTLLPTPSSTHPVPGAREDGWRRRAAFLILIAAALAAASLALGSASEANDCRTGKGAAAASEEDDAAQC